MALMKRTSLMESFHLNDPNGNIDIDGRMNISPKNFMANIEAKANQLNINALKITNKYPQTNFSFVLSTNFTGKDINSLNGRIDLKDFKWYLIS